MNGTIYYKTIIPYLIQQNEKFYYFSGDLFGIDTKNPLVYIIQPLII